MVKGLKPLLQPVSLCVILLWTPMHGFYTSSTQKNFRVICSAERNMVLFGCSCKITKELKFQVIVFDAFLPFFLTHSEYKLALTLVRGKMSRIQGNS